MKGALDTGSVRRDGLWNGRAWSMPLTFRRAHTAVWLEVMQQSPSVLVLKESVVDHRFCMALLFI